MNLFESQSTEFQGRHIGPNSTETKAMLETIGISSLEELIDKTIPEKIRLQEPLALTSAVSEQEYLAHLKEVAAKNKLFKKQFPIF